MRLRKKLSHKNHMILSIMKLMNLLKEVNRLEAWEGLHFSWWKTVTWGEAVTCARAYCYIQGREGALSCHGSVMALVSLQPSFKT